jgi:flavin reductase (DIM6/NTAB) family NADH-FMN oxidoreductase RutF
VFPGTAVLVSCSSGGRDNVFTVAWMSKVCMKPPKIAIAVNKQRHSHGMLKESGEFVVNIPGIGQAREVDYCGTNSGREVDKFGECKFTKAEGKYVSAPLIKECPANIECKVTESLLLGSHEIFIGEVLAYWVNSEYHDGKRFDYGRIQPLVDLSPEYWDIGKKRWDEGFSRK